MSRPTTYAGRPVAYWTPEPEPDPHPRLTRGHVAGCDRPGWFQIARHGVALVRCAGPRCRATYRARPEYLAALARPNRKDNP